MKALACLGVAAATLIALPALAHHSHAMFDHTREVTVTGTVSGYAFRNPHVFLYVDSKEPSGEMTTWWIEMSNITNMIRRGVRADSFKEGDQLTVTMHPLQNGKPGGNYMKITTADGKVYE